MSAYYGSRFADAWRGIDPAAMKRCWAEELAGYTGEEIAQGVALLKTRAFPPTLPEFLNLCRKPVDIKADWIDACEQMPIRLRGDGSDRWNRPEVYWAAVKIGAFDLHSNSWDQIKTRWQAAIESAKSAPIPEYLAALPALGAQTVTKEEAVNRIADMKNLIGVSSPLGTTKAGTKWAYALMEREANGETVEYLAGQMWREALGYPKDANAKAALQAIKERNAA